MYIFDITIFWIHIAPSYYWLMYALGFLWWFYILKNRWIISKKILDDLLIYMILWVVLWGRIGYILLYNFNSYINNPLEIFKIWEWWMSFHGWVIWVIVAMILFSRKFKINFYKLVDQVTAVLPIWLWLGRIWNYLNKELLGFSWYTGPLSVNWRFPSPLIEMFLEWIILFIILNLVYKKKQFDGQIASLFLILYWIFRIFVEAVFREPDSHIWYILDYFTLWEIYSLPMIIFWVYFYITLKKKNAHI
jgi:phosphatidylglycerol:prolipoprotein diacylglycerol transferase